MSYQIDQSNKIEKTEKPTVLAYASDTDSYSVLIPAKPKRQLQESFRMCGMNRLFIYHVFAAGVYFLLANLKKQSEVVIDVEYPGNEKIILSIIEKLLIAYNKPAHNIRFGKIGNSPKVHYAAHDVSTKKKPADRVLNLLEIIEALKKTDGRLRECLSTLVDAQPRSLIKRYHKNPKKSMRQQ